MGVSFCLWSQNKLFIFSPKQNIAKNEAIVPECCTDPVELERMRCEEPLREGELVSIYRELQKHGNRPELGGVVINRRELEKLRLIDMNERQGEF